MFSGIKSILFGSGPTDHETTTVSQTALASSQQQDNSNDNNNNDDGNTNSSQSDSSDHQHLASTRKLISATKHQGLVESTPKYILTAIQEKTGLNTGDPSTLIEQTLNAAATRFTEQLVPKSASIEELQLSSRQILPTLTEQKVDLTKSYANLKAHIDDDGEGAPDDFNCEEDDDDVDDTWELLDLVERNTLAPVETTSSNLVSSQSAHSTTSASEHDLDSEFGTHRQEIDANILNEAQAKESRGKRTRGHKLKVSFETSDLVKIPPEDYARGQVEENNHDQHHNEIDGAEGDDERVEEEEEKEEDDDDTSFNLVIESADGDGEVHLDRQSDGTATITTAKNNSFCNFSSGTGSHSDLTEMDESWYVTPPPCFTGSNYNNLNKFKSPKATKDAARENALIEHPSIYISSNPGRQQESCLQDLTPSRNLIEKNTEITKNNIEADGFEESDREDGSRVSDEVLIPSVHEDDDLEEVVDEQDDEDDDVAEVSEIEADEMESGVETKDADINLVSVRVYENEEGPIDSMVLGKEITSLEDSVSSSFERHSSMAPSHEKKNCPADGRKQQAEKQDPDQCRPPSGNSERTDISCTSSSNTSKRAPLSVRPIEPERQPGWQLRRKRSKRRPLSAISVQNTCNALSNNNKRSTTKANALTERPKNNGNTNGNCMNTITVSDSGSGVATPSMISSASFSSSATASGASRDSPAFISRIGCSIVANLNNLTNGLPIRSRTAMEEAEKMSQSVLRKSADIGAVLAQRRLSKAYLDRQNDCARLGNSNRRVGRRLKMHSTPNGCSIDRKVHTNFH